MYLEIFEKLAFSLLFWGTKNKKAMVIETKCWTSWLLKWCNSWLAPLTNLLPSFGTTKILGGSKDTYSVQKA